MSPHHLPASTRTVHTSNYHFSSEIPTLKILFCVYIYNPIKQTRDKEATGDYGVPGDIPGEDSFRLTTKLINKLYETGEWPKCIPEVTMTALKKEPEESKFSDRPTISLSAHTAKTEETILKT
jgi:hypothetical protein